MNMFKWMAGFKKNQERYPLSVFGEGGNHRQQKFDLTVQVPGSEWKSEREIEGA